MKLPPIKNSIPVKFIRSLYYANKPLPMYKPQPQRPLFLKKENKFIRFLKKIL